jgi:hypothetical protein
MQRAFFVSSLRLEKAHQISSISAIRQDAPSPVASDMLQYGFLLRSVQLHHHDDLEHRVEKSWKGAAWCFWPDF